MEQTRFGYELTAIHEAAHTVAFALHGLEEYIDELHVEASGLTLGTLQVKQGLLFPLFTADPNHLVMIENICISLLSAKQAEMKWLRQERPSAGEDLILGFMWTSGVNDVEQAVELASQRFAADTLAEVTAYIKYVWIRAKAFVDHPENWQAIQTLAAAATEMRRIKRELCLTIIKDAQSRYRGGSTSCKCCPVAQMAEAHDFESLVKELLIELRA